MDCGPGTGAGPAFTSWRENLPPCVPSKGPPGHTHVLGTLHECHRADPNRPCVGVSSIRMLRNRIDTKGAATLRAGGGSGARFDIPWQLARALRAVQRNEAVPLGHLGWRDEPAGFGSRRHGTRREVAVEDEDDRVAGRYAR